jgi:hypothetical protein
VRERREAPAARAEIASDAVAELLETFDAVAMGLSAGVVCGALLFLATLILVLKGGAVVGPTLALVAEYFPGYSVTAAGSLVGLAYGVALGFAGGWAFAGLRTMASFLFLALARRQFDLRMLGRLLE